MSTVVVLNASFEPLGVVTLKRAMVHLMRERAVIVEAVPGETVKSAEAEYPLPRVVQFREMVRVPYRFDKQPWTSRGVLERDGRRCAYCSSGKGNTVDHIFPKSRMLKGTADTWMNTVASCLRCNNSKADKTPEEAGMKLLFQPREVTRRDTLLVAIAQTGADLAMLGLA